MLSLHSQGVGPRPRRRVEILGAFGSGKTTLARRVAGMVGDLLLEDHLSNPFWGQDHPLAVTGYLPYDLSFLVQHARLAAGQPVRPGLAVCDWSFVTDRLWASMRLDGDLAAYDAAHGAICARLGPPSLYIHLDLPAALILARLERRGRSFEADFARHVDEAAWGVRSLAAALPAGAVLCLTDDNDVDVLIERLSEGGDRVRE